MKKTFQIGFAVIGMVGIANAEIPASYYVQDGLIGHWDAIDNVGYGQHDGAASAWKNLVHGSPVGDLILSKLKAYEWGKSFLNETPGAYTSDAKLQTTNSVNLGSSFTIEVMAKSANGRIRRFDQIPQSTGFESWGSEKEGYLERLGDTRFTAQNSIVKNANLGFVTTYDGATHAQFVRLQDGTLKSQSKAKTGFSFNKPMAFISNDSDGVRCVGYAIRLYSRVLSEQERAYNSALDQMRYDGRDRTAVVLPNGWSIDANLNLVNANGDVLITIGSRNLVWTGAAQTEDWSDAGNWQDDAGNGTTVCPGGSDRVTIAENCAVSVTSTVKVLSLTVGANSKVNVGTGVELCASEATYAGESVARLILSGNARNGSAAAWVAGDGVVRVAGGLARTMPILYREPAADGWYEFGLASKYTMTEKKGWSSATDINTRPFVQAEKVDWSDYDGLPADAKVRLVGGVLMNAIPAGMFSEVDISSLKQLTLYDRAAFANGRVISVQKDVSFRYSPGTWEFHAETNGWYQTSVNSVSFTNTIEMAGGTFYVNGNGTHYSNQILDGGFIGTSGTIKLDNFSNHLTVNGAWGFSGTIGFNSDQGGTLRIFSDEVSGEINSVKMLGCTGKYATNAQYCAAALLFGPKSGATKIADELKIGSLSGYASALVYDTKGVHYRNGGEIIVWGGRTVHVRDLSNGIHVMADVKNQNCDNGDLLKVQTFGMGNVIIDNLKSGSVFASTNVNLTVGRVASSSTVFDYTYQANDINRSTLVITGACNVGSKVLATDIAMLPATLKGFAGKVELTDTATKTYPVAIDLAKGPTENYNDGGVDGSGELTAAPADGTINVSFVGLDAPKKGTYSIARFTSGGEKLQNWAVTLNGESATRITIGTGDNMKTVTLLRDSSGIYVKVSNPGFRAIVR